jgi:hypothetical protein
MRLSNNTAKPLSAIHFYWHDIAFELGSLLGGDGARSTSQSLLGLGTSSDEPEKAESDGDFCTLLLSGSFLSFLICRSISQDVSKRSSSVVSWAVSKSDNSLPLSFSASVLLSLALLLFKKNQLPNQLHCQLFLYWVIAIINWSYWINGSYLTNAFEFKCICRTEYLAHSLSELGLVD